MGLIEALLTSALNFQLFVGYVSSRADFPLE